jgi:putative tricarboxylic transport membrane protein
VAVAAWGGFALWKAFEIEEPSAYRPMGPRVFPILISTSLIVLGLLFVVQTLRGTDVAVEEHVAGELREADHKQAALIVGLLVAYAMLFNRAGYVVATTVFFPAVARVLGSRQPLRDVIVAALLAITAFLVFTRLLSIDLPVGVLGDTL